MNKVVLFSFGFLFIQFFDVVFLQELFESSSRKHGCEKSRYFDKQLRTRDTKINNLQNQITENQNTVDQLSSELELVKTEMSKCHQRLDGYNESNIMMLENIKTQEQQLHLSQKLIQNLDQKFAVLLEPEQDCVAIYNKGMHSSEIHKISPDKQTAFNVYCDMEGGGWTLIQRRVDDSVNFVRGWEEYANGFGDLSGNFWLGLKYIHLLTSTPVDILFEVVTMDTNETALMRYSDFYIDGPANSYTVHVNVTGTYNAEAERRQYTRLNGFGYQNGKPFSTFDRPDASGCVNRYGKGGWWYKDCWEVLLNNPFDQMNVKAALSGGEVIRSEIKVKRAL